jgi:acyl-CoA synthetase (AMP-forming)/AMP-acid ligase II
VEAIVAERCTALHGVPAHFLGVLAEADKREKAGEKLDVSSLRYVALSILRSLVRTNLAYRTGIAGGSPIPIDLMKKIITKLNLVDLTIAYGMSEFEFTPFFSYLKLVYFTAETRYFDILKRLLCLES